LKGEIMVRNLPTNLLHLAYHRGLVRTAYQLTIARLVEEGDAASEWCWQADLKAEASRDFALLAQIAKNLVGLGGPTGVLEIIKIERFDARSQSEDPAVSVVTRDPIGRFRARHGFERWMPVEDEDRLALDPTLSWPNLAVRERQEMRP
jgi:hypothetical protein